MDGDIYNIDKYSYMMGICIMSKAQPSLILITHITRITYITQNFIILHILGYTSTTLLSQLSSASYYCLSYWFLSFSNFLPAYSIFVILVCTVFPRLFLFLSLFFPLISNYSKPYVVHSWHIKYHQSWKPY